MIAANSQSTVRAPSEVSTVLNIHDLPGVIAQSSISFGTIVGPRLFLGGEWGQAFPLPPSGVPLQAFFQSELWPILALDLVLWLWVWLAPTLVLPCRFLPEGILGLALPGLVLVRPETYTWAILRHELTHIRQMRRWSPLGTWLAQAFSYLVRPLWILLGQRRLPSLRELYRLNPLEREAFAAMDQDGPLPRTWGATPAQSA